jgi:hypothetical protein
MDTLHDIAEGKSIDAGNPYWVYPERTKNPDWDETAYNKIYKEVRAAFQSEGCSALDSKCNKPSELHDRTYGLTPQDAASVLYEVLGDDLNGAAAMLEDMGY